MRGRDEREWQSQVPLWQEARVGIGHKQLSYRLIFWLLFLFLSFYQVSASSEQKLVVPLGKCLSLLESHLSGADTLMAGIQAY